MRDYNITPESAIGNLLSGNINAFSYVYSVFCRGTIPEKKQAAAAFERFFLTVDAVSLFRIKTYCSLSDSDKARPFVIGALSLLGKEKTAALKAMTFDASGHIREKAVNAVSGLPGALPFIALRLNDWVSQVREASLEAFSDTLRSASDEEAAAVLPMIWRLGGCHRIDCYEKVIELLRAEAEKRPLFSEKVFLSGDAAARKIFLQRLADVRRDREVIVRYGLCDRDPYIRSMCFDVLGGNDSGLIDLFLRDRNPALRAKALNAVYRSDPGKALTYAEKMLCDERGSIRWLARFIVMRQRPDTVLRDVYREKLPDARGKELAGCISGLAENGKPEDGPVIEPFLGPENPTYIVKAAVSALLLLDSGYYAPKITPMLLSDSASVSKHVYRLLAKNKYTDFDVVYEYYKERSRSDDPERSYRCARVLFSAPKWQRLIYILDILETTGDKKLACLCHGELDLWLDSCGRTFTAPSAAQRETLKALTGSSRRLSEGELKRLRFYMKGI